jgi:hypothetical protein
VRPLGVAIFNYENTVSDIGGFIQDSKKHPVRRHDYYPLAEFPAFQYFQLFSQKRDFADKVFLGLKQAEKQFNKNVRKPIMYPPENQERYVLGYGNAG